MRKRWRRVVLGLALALSGTSAPAYCGDAAITDRYVAAVSSLGVAGPAAFRRGLVERVLLISGYYGVDARLVVAVVTAESAWNSRAVSSAGAYGLGQLMPGTAAGLDVDVTVPAENLDGTARYLRRLLAHYATGDQRRTMALAVAAYNAGSAAVDRYHGTPPYRETQGYVTRVLALYDRLAAVVPAGGAVPEPARLEAARALRREWVDVAVPLRNAAAGGGAGTMEGAINHARR